MSASQIKQFIQKVSAHFEAPEDELQAMWDTLIKYAKMTKPQLVQECADKGFATTGTKKDLINRLEGKEETEVPKKTRKKRQKKTIPIDSLSNVKTHVIEKNEKEQWVHQPSGLILEEKKTIAYARIVDGAERELTIEDIPVCKEYAFEWKLD